MCVINLAFKLRTKYYHSIFVNSACPNIKMIYETSITNFDTQRND